MPLGRSRIAARTARSISAVLRASTGYTVSLSTCAARRAASSCAGPVAGSQSTATRAIPGIVAFKISSHFPAELGQVHEHARDVAAGPRNRFHKSRRHGVALEIESNDGNPRRRGTCRHHPRAGHGEDQIGTECRQLGRERGQRAAVAQSHVERQIASLRVPGGAERVAKPVEVGPEDAVVHAGIEHTDTNRRLRRGHVPRRLRGGGRCDQQRGDRSGSDHTERPDHSLRAGSGITGDRRPASGRQTVFLLSERQREHQKGPSRKAAPEGCTRGVLSERRACSRGANDADGPLSVVRDGAGG